MYKSLLQPRNIVVCGPAVDKNRVLPKLIRNIKKSFRGGVFVVRPDKKGSRTQKTHTSVGQILEDIDLAVLQLPMTRILPTLRECGEQGVKAVVVLSTNKTQRKISTTLRRQITAVGVRYGMHILGPRSSGFVDTYGINASTIETPKRGMFSLVSRSMRRTEEINNWMNKEGYGFSKIFTLGERAGLTENELMLMLDQDKQTKAMLFCLEEFADQKNFLRLVDIVSERKEVVIVPTGSMFGDKFAKSAAFQRAAQKGALTTHSLDEFFNTVQTVAKANERINLLEKLGIWR